MPVTLDTKEIPTQGAQMSMSVLPHLYIQIAKQILTASIPLDPTTVTAMMVMKEIHMLDVLTLMSAIWVQQLMTDARQIHTVLTRWARTIVVAILDTREILTLVALMLMSVLLHLYTQDANLTLTVSTLLAPMTVLAILATMVIHMLDAVTSMNALLVLAIIPIVKPIHIATIQMGGIPAIA